jgi:hypothetical protein
VSEIPADSRDLHAIFSALFDIRRDVTLILRLLTEDDEQEEEDWDEDG